MRHAAGCPARRRGLSYLEVLIAAAIGLVGTLGALALFPVAILQMQRGLQADTANAVGESAVRSAEALGLNDPRRWMICTASGSAFARLEDENVYASNRQEAAYRPWNPQVNALSSFCIDPRFVAEVSGNANPGTAVANSDGQEYWLFPYAPRLTNSGNPVPDDVRMWRMSLSSAAAASGMLTSSHARLLFRSQDDLAFNRKVDDTSFDGSTLDRNGANPTASMGALPAWQRFITSNPTDPTSHFSPATWQRRDYMAEYEWIATLVPKSNGQTQLTDNMGNVVSYSQSVISGEYVMSIVVFNKRRAGGGSLLVNHVNQNTFVEEERIADVARFYANGLGGGDIQVRSRFNIPGVSAPYMADRPAEDLFVRESDWVLLGGMVKERVDINGTSTEVDVAPLFQWYRVVGVQGDVSGSGPYFRNITLQGADWPAEITPAPTPPQTYFIRNTQVTFVSGVVGVFERTIQLE